MTAAEAGIEDGKSAEHIKDLLLEDYRYRADSLWKNEQSGETRLNFYIGFVTLVIGALVTLAKDSPHVPLRPVALASLGMLLAFGIITLMRMLTRNEHTDLCKRGLDTIRQTFKDHFDRAGMLVDYYPVALPKMSKDPGDRKRKVGGLAYTVAVINSALVGMMIVAAAFPSSEPVPLPQLPLGIYLVASTAALVAFVAQVTCAERREARSEVRLKRGMPTHAGGVVFRVDNGIVKYLIVKPKSGADQWLLPKGHIKEDEGHGEAALREVREETGVAGRLCAFVSRVTFKDGDDEIDAKFYLIEGVHEVEKRGDRLPPEWHPFKDAFQKLEFEESKLVLLEAERRRCALSEPLPGSREGGSIE